MSSITREQSYLPFAQSPIWEQARDFYQTQGYDIWSSAQVPEWNTTNPHLAHCYAQIVLGFWRDAQKRNTEFRETFYIIELGAGSGRFAHHFLQLFLPMFDILATPEDRICYVMSDFCEATAQAWRDNPKFQPFVQQGRLDFALFDAETDTRFDLLESRRLLAPGELACPPVIIANGVFSSLRQDLFFVEHKKLYEGWLKLEENPTGDEDEQTSLPSEQYTLHYQKRPLTNPGYTDTAHMQWLQDYAQSLPACALLFPFRALALLENLRTLHGSDMLLLSADSGLLNAAEIAAQYEPEWLVDDGLAFPVNYHALDAAITSAGGQLWHSAPRTKEQPAIVAAIYGAPQEWPEARLAVKNNFQLFNPLDFYSLHGRLGEDAEYFTPQQMLAYLRLSHWDTQIFHEFFPHLKVVGLPKIQQDQWCEVLSQIAKMHLPIGEGYDLAFDLAALAGSMHRWSLALDLFHQSLSFKGPQAATQANIGIAHWQMGDLQKAESALRTAVALWAIEQQQIDKTEGSSSDTLERENPIQAQLDALGLWQSKCRSLLGPTAQVQAETSSHSHIYLTLLGTHQAEALYLHQRQTTLARQAGVRVLNSVRDAHSWIQQDSANNKTPLAVMHPQCGLIGLAVLETRTPLLNGTHNVARFYYWITPDHQNLGHGTQALALMHQFAASYGIKYLFSAVHRANLKSQRAMAKTGYERLNFALTQADTENALDFYLKVLSPGAAASEFERYQAFAVFIQAFAEPIELAPFEGDEALEVTRLKPKLTEPTPAEAP